MEFDRFSACLEMSWVRTVAGRQEVMSRESINPARTQAPYNPSQSNSGAGRRARAGFGISSSTRTVCLARPGALPRPSQEPPPSEHSAHSTAWTVARDECWCGLQRTVHGGQQARVPPPRWMPQGIEAPAMEPFLEGPAAMTVTLSGHRDSSWASVGSSSRSRRAGPRASTQFRPAKSR